MVDESSSDPSSPRQSGRAIFWRLMRQVRPPWAALSAIALLTLLGTFLAILLPWPLQFLVDHILGHQPMPVWAGHALAVCGVHTKTGAILALALTGFLLQLSNGLLAVARTQLGVSAGQRSIYDLRARLFEHYERQYLHDHRAISLGDQLYRLTNDASCVDQLVFSGLLPLAGAASTLLAMFCVLWRIDWSLALLALAVLPFLVVCVLYYMGPLESASVNVREREAAALSFAERVLSSLPVVKVFVSEAAEARRFRDQGHQALSARLRLTAQETWFGLACTSVIAGGTALVLAIGGLHVARGTLTIGQLLVVIAYLAQVYDPLHIISFTFGQMQAAVAGARRIVSVLDTPGEALAESAHAKPLNPITGHIVFDRVIFGYSPGRPILNDVSLEVAPGSIVAIVGPTGAGKTTLLSLMLRFYDPQSGSVSIDGVDLRGVTVTSLRRQISVVLQESVLLPVSIGENIRYGRPDASEDEVQAAAIAAHAHEFISALPLGYDTVVSGSGNTLSGGERQRIALARAFLKDAPILILDEPTSSLDASTESLILESLGTLMATRTTLVIAHRLSTIRRANQILFLQDGRIVERGTHSELLAGEGSYSRLHELYMRVTGTDT